MNKWGYVETRVQAAIRGVGRRACDERRTTDQDDESVVCRWKPCRLLLRKSDRSVFFCSVNVESHVLSIKYMLFHWARLDSATSSWYVICSALISAHCLADANQLTISIKHSCGNQPWRWARLHCLRRQWQEKYFGSWTYNHISSPNQGRNRASRYWSLK